MSANRRHSSGFRAAVRPGTVLTSLVVLAGFAMLATWLVREEPSAGVLLEQRPALDRSLRTSQIVGDPRHGGWLSRAGGPGFFLAAAGDPEDFFYRGALNADGTRSGDQMEIIETLARSKANGLYLQIVRSHGGDGDATHNPFVDHDPAKGLNPQVLRQWHGWLTVMNENGIVPFVFVYDDSARIWDSGDGVGKPERGFLKAIVEAFSDIQDLVWVVAEEYQEAFSAARVSAIARVIAEAELSQRVIGVHKNDGLDFTEFANDPFINQFLIQRNGIDDETIYRELSAAWISARGRYSLILAESEGWGRGRVAQRKAWAAALGGAGVMVYQWIPNSALADDFSRLGRMAVFMAETDFLRMRPAPTLISGDTAFLLAEPGQGFVAYAKQSARRVGVRGLAPGHYELHWFDPASGLQYAEQFLQAAVGDALLPVPVEFNDDVVVFARRIATPVETVFPGKDWAIGHGQGVRIDKHRLDAFAEKWGGDGCVFHQGHLAYCWGDPRAKLEWASASKPLLATLLMMAIQDNRIGHADVQVRAVGWALRGKDKQVTFHQLANMTSGYARSEEPGGAWAYNDIGIRLYGLSIERLFGRSIDEVAKDKFAPLAVQAESIFTSRNGLGVEMSILDMARFGHLWLMGGRWKREQLVETRLFEQFRQVQVPPDLPLSRAEGVDTLQVGSFGGSSNQAGFGPGIFGYNWWFNVPTSVSAGFLWSSLPADAFQASGHWGKKQVSVVPSMGLVIVTHGQEIEKADFGSTNSGENVNVMLADIIGSIRFE